MHASLIDFRMRMSRPTLCFLGCAAALLLPAVGRAQSWTAAQAAFMGQRFAQAESLYRAVRRDDADFGHRRSATLMLGTLSWRVDSDTVRANAYLDSLGEMAAAPRDTTAARALVERSRMELASGNVAGALATARSAFAMVAPGPPDAPIRADAAVALGNAVLEPYRSCVERDTPSSARGAACPAVPGKTAVHDVHAVLLRQVQESPGALGPAELLVESAALLRDRDALRLGWESYYLSELDPTSAGTILSAAHRTMRSESPWDALLRGLTSSALYDAAALVTLAPDGSLRTDPAARAAAETVPYAAYNRAVRVATDTYYRTLAGGAAVDTAQWLDTFHRLTRQVASRYSGISFDALDVDSATRILVRRFGVRINNEHTAGIHDLHMGHAVIDERWTVTQYGHAASVHFVSLDGMVSNGYQSWAWDGHAAHGGWGTDSTIVQVRPVYARGPQAVWPRLTDPRIVRDAATKLTQDSAGDVVHAKREQTGYFPGVEERLMRDGQHELLTTLEAKGYRGRELEQRFKAAYAAATRQSSIVAHEGRHAIDATLHLPLTSAQREYRAKLSEVAFATIPRLALGSILNATTGNDTPHGTANAQLLAVLTQWIDAHRGRVAGATGTASVPAVLLIPNLTDAQLREITRLADPLAH